jgi:putative membrane protein
MSTSRVSDRTFARKAAEGGLAEVKLGQLAQEKGATQTVKNFGQRMVTDHSKANDQLKSVASAQNIPLPSALHGRDRITDDRLSKLSGATFDHAYARDMVRDHEKDIAVFEAEAKHGKNSSIRNFAAQTLPTLRAHLRLARAIYHSVLHHARTAETHGSMP